MFLTREDYLKIEAYLKQNAMKDSDFEKLDLTKESYSALGGNDRVVVNHYSNGKYLNGTVNITKMLSGFLAAHTIPETAKVDNFDPIYKDKLAPVEKIWNAIDKHTTNIPFNHLSLNVQRGINNSIKKITINGTDRLVDYTYSTPLSADIVGTLTQLSANLTIPYAGLDNGLPVGGKAKTAATADKVAHTITIGGKLFNGSSDVEITKADLGIGSAFQYVGISSTNPMVSGATVENFIGSWERGCIVFYDGDQYILNENGNIASHWDFLMQSTGFATVAQLNELESNVYTKSEIDDELGSMGSDLYNAIATKYAKPSSGIPIGDFSTELADTINEAASQAGAYLEAIDANNIELTNRKINNWNDLQEADSTKELQYPSARLVKNSIDTINTNIGDSTKIVRLVNGKIPVELLPDNYIDISEFVTKLQKTTISLTPDKTLAEIDGSSINDIVTFTGKLEIDTFGDFGKRTINPSEFTNMLISLDNNTMDTTTTASGVVASKLFIEDDLDNQLVGNHIARFTVNYKGTSYNTSCQVAVNLRKFFFFGEFNNADVLPDFTANTLNNSLILGYDAFNCTSHFSTSKNCTITVPASYSNTPKYIYFLIPKDMVSNILNVIQPDAFNAKFDVEHISDTTRIIHNVNNPEETYLSYGYKVFRSTTPIDSSIAKKLTIV